MTHRGLCRAVGLGVCLCGRLVSAQNSPGGFLPAQSLKAAPSEQPPVYVEYLFGNDRFDLETLVTKKFSELSHFGILSVTNAQGQYNNSLESNSFDFVNVTQVSYSVRSGLGATLGLSLNRETGFNTTVGLQYVYHKPTFLLLLSPSVFVEGNHDLQNVLVAQYQPVISKDWRLYELALVIDDLAVTPNTDARSLLHIRSGANYRKATFGFGADLDRYGLPTFSSRRSFGPFIAYSF